MSDHRIARVVVVVLIAGALIQLPSAADEATLKTIEQLSTELRHEDSAVREAAARRLGDTRDERAIEPLLGVLRDEDRSVRWWAADALADLGWVPQTEEEKAVYLIASHDWWDWRELAKIGAPAIEPLAEALTDTDPWVRRVAVETLCKISGPEVRQTLVHALGAQDPYVRCEAAKALGRIGGPQAVEALMRALRDHDKSVQSEAVETLGRIGDPNAVEPLVEVLTDESGYVRARAAEALGQLGDGRAVKPLVDALADADSSVRLAAARAVDRLNWVPQTANEQVTYLAARRQWSKLVEMRPAVVRPLVRALEDQHPDVCKPAAQTLDSLNWKPQTDHERAIYLAAKGDWQELGKMGPPAVEHLIDGLTHGSRLAAQQASRGLVEIGDEKAVEALVRALRDDYSGIRSSAARALGQIGGAAVVKPLVRALADNDESVRRDVAETLDTLGWRPQTEDERITYLIAKHDWGGLGGIGAPAVLPLVRLLQESAYGMPPGATRTLTAVADEQAVLPLIKILETGGRFGRTASRTQAAEVLGHIGDERAIGPLLRTLRDRNDILRYSAAVALGRIRRPALPVLIEALGSDHPWVREGAAQALGAIRDKQAVPELIRVLGDRKSYVRQAAAWTLGVIGDEQAVPFLLKALDDEDENVRRYAVSALRRMNVAVPDEPSDPSRDDKKGDS